MAKAGIPVLESVRKVFLLVQELLCPPKPLAKAGFLAQERVQASDLILVSDLARQVRVLDWVQELLCPPKPLLAHP